MISRLLPIAALLLFICQEIAAKVLINNGLTHIHSGKQGQVIKGMIQVKNAGAQPEKILIYQNGLVQTCDEKSEFVPVDRQVRGMGKWLETNTVEKLIQPDETFEIFYTISIPRDSSLSGSYWSVVMVEVAEPVTIEATNKFSIGSKIRYAIQIITDVGEMEFPKLDFEKVAFKPVQAANKVIQAKLKNIGKFMVVPKLLLEVYGKDGQKIITLESVSQKIYPFTCKDFEIEIKGLTSGKYDAILVADYGQDLFATNMVIDI